MIKPRSFGLATAAAVLFLGVPAARAADAAPEKGDLWEVTSQMSMEGMPMAMPVQKAKTCSHKVWTQAPAPANEQQKCQNSDFKIDGPKVTWKVTCTSPAMTGEGEITRDGADAYAGTIKFTGEQGVLTIKLSGRKTGECDNPQ